MVKVVQAFKTISDVAKEVGVQTHVLRFWETKFSQIKPMKRSGGRRYYRTQDIELLSNIKYYLHDKRYTIEGVQKLIKSRGLKSIDRGQTIDVEISSDNSLSFLDKPIRLTEKNRNILSDLRSQLQDLKQKLLKTLEE